MIYYSSSFFSGHQITIAEKAGKVSALSFGVHRIPEGVEKNTGLIIEAKRQLEEYFQGRRTEFQLPLAPEGTAFQRQVWEKLQRIPYGETRTYKEIAKQMGNERACRAVGMANHRNPIAIMIPCHRVIGKDGGPRGYAGGVDKKCFLLELERRVSAAFI